MNILPDTSVWTLALRRRKGDLHPKARKLQHLIASGHQVFVSGVIVQEILQGIREDTILQRVLEDLSLFEFVEPDLEDHVAAAALFRKCRGAGVSISTVDVLIAALAIRHDCYLLTNDDDFKLLMAHSDLALLD